MKRCYIPIGFLFVLPLIAYGLAVKTRSPSLSFPSEASDATISRTLKFLNEDVTFIEGWFFNRFQWQSYHAEGSEISEALRVLQRAGLGVTLRFAALEEEQVAFQVHQMGPDEATLTINVTHPKLEWDGLEARLPPIRTEASSSNSEAQPIPD